MKAGSFLLGISIMMTALFLGGCQGKREGALGTEEAANASMAENAAEYEFLEMEEVIWKDNTLDDLQAVWNLPVEKVKAEGEQIGGTEKYAAGYGGMVRFKNHLVGNYKKDWSGVNGIKASGEKYSEPIAVEPEVVGRQIDLLGVISGKDGYVAYRDELDENYDVMGRWFYELNADFEKEWGIYIEEPSSVEVSTIMGDKEGNFHIIFRGEQNGNFIYRILSGDGTKLFEAAGNFSRGLRAFGDGRVAVLEEVIDEGRLEGQKLLEADLSKGKLTEIGLLSMQNVCEATGGTDLLQPYFTCYCYGKEQFLWCGKEGVYLCDSEGKDSRLAYRWSNHGISLQAVYDVYSYEDGNVGVVYQDAEGINYLLLKPTGEKAEIKTILFAVSPFHKDEYQRAAAYFNKKYPAYNIEVKEDYEELTLLTQMGAGDGPVLVDTALTGFEGLKKLWQPLDGFLRQSGLEEEMIAETLDFGKIDGRSYGLVTSFEFRTLMVMDQKLMGWNYDDFLGAVENYDGPVFTYDFSNRADYRNTFFAALGNGVEDNAYIDPESGKSIFEAGEFERLLKLSEKAKNCPKAEGGKTLEEGKVLCEILNVYSVESLLDLRTRLEAGECIAGYPTKEGARNLLAAADPIAVRSTATDEEKQMAYTFLKMLLSYDGAKQADFGGLYNNLTLFSVRKDIVEEQFDEYAKKYAQGKGDKLTEWMPEPKKEEDKKLFETLLKDSTVQKSFPTDLQNVFDREVSDYLEGVIDGKMLEDHLKSRMLLYMEEQK